MAALMTSPFCVLPAPFIVSVMTIIVTGQMNASRIGVLASRSTLASGSAKADGSLDLGLGLAIHGSAFLCSICC